LSIADCRLPIGIRNHGGLLEEARDLSLNTIGNRKSEIANGPLSYKPVARRD
jgi:hypothetical protein